MSQSIAPKTGSVALSLFRFRDTPGVAFSSGIDATRSGSILGNSLNATEPDCTHPWVLWDYVATGLTLRSHALALLRPILAKRWLTAAQLQGVESGRAARACGIVTVRQQPETAKGTVFVSLEDETGSVQIICWKSVRDSQRQVLLKARLLAVTGEWQREGAVCNLIAAKVEDLTHLLGRLATASRDFR